MKRLRNTAMILFFALAFLIIVVCGYYRYNIMAVDKNDDEEIEVEIESGTSTKEIGALLEEKGLIRNGNVFYIYCYIWKVNDIKATTYTLTKSMDVETIVEVLREGNSYNPDSITITFQEGINMRKVATIISENTNNTYDEVFEVVSDSSYIKELINEYWFLDSVITSSDIYYPLEGYLFPDTYEFSSVDVTVKEIFEKMLDETDKVLTNYKDDITSSGYSVHELLTLASIVELEGVNEDDRASIASVFYNRLNSNMSLGSDATTYYGVKLEMNERDLTTDEINSVNGYNTRLSSMTGKLPVGPIANVSEVSLKAVLYPATTDYYYFVADKYGNVYFTKTYSEHLAKVQELKDEGAWIEW